MIYQHTEPINKNQVFPRVVLLYNSNKIDQKSSDSVHHTTDFGSC
jgi:hypothetical protein